MTFFTWLFDTMAAILKDFMEAPLRKFIFPLFFGVWAYSDLALSAGLPTPENLGQPFPSKGVYARNVWDMQVYNGLIYLGHGNSSNIGPDTNAGPIPVVAWNPTQNLFASNYSVSEEQINSFRILSGLLSIPGHDSRDAGTLGSFYRLENSQWIKRLTIPNGTHVFDIASFSGKLFAALGSNESSIYSSNDDGATWSPALTSPLANTASVGGTGGRVYGLFEMEGKLYALTQVRRSDMNFDLRLLRYNSSSSFFEEDTSVPTQSAGSNFSLGVFPGRTFTWSAADARLARTVLYKDELLYVGASTVNDMQWEPFGLYAARNGFSFTRAISLSGRTPWDLLVIDNRALVLTSQKLSSSPLNYRIEVLSSDDATTWTSLLAFEATTFARSFEYLNGYFYFGLGTTADELSPDTGDILKVLATVPSTADITAPAAPRNLNLR